MQFYQVGEAAQFGRQVPDQPVVAKAHIKNTPATVSADTVPFSKGSLAQPVCVFFQLSPPIALWTANSAALSVSCLPASVVGVLSVSTSTVTDPHADSATAAAHQYANTHGNDGHTEE